MSEQQSLNPVELSMDDGSAAWEALAAHAGKFLAAWQQGGQPPAIDDFLPAEPRALRRMALVELVKIDLEHRLQGGGPWKSVEQYGREYPELCHAGGLPCDLVYEEFHARQLAGETVSYDEYLDRFPAQAESLRRLFGFRSTRMVKQPAAQPGLALAAGQQVEEFEVLRALGEGAFGQVYLAWQKSLQRRVALKLSARESDEPQTLAQLDHPNIVRVYDQRLLPQAAAQFIYMEYLPGGNLQSVAARVRETPPAARTGRLLLEVVDAALAAHGEPAADSELRARLAAQPWTDVVCWLGAQLAAALDYAHTHQTLHRDLKPANVLLTAAGVPKLVDFNIAYSSKLEGASPAAYFGGSVGYMAPEHLEAFSPYHPREPGELDGRSDIYSLGLVLWELLTGQRPFPQEKVSGDWEITLQQIIDSRRAGVSPQAIAQLPTPLPPGLREALLRCLDPDPQRRYATAGELARDLRLAIDPEVRQARTRQTGGWHQTARRHVWLAGVLAGIAPHFLLSVVNVSYDWFGIVLPRLPQDTHVVFLGTLVTLLKTTLYGSGIALGLWLARPAFGLLRAAAAADAAAVAAARRRAANLGLLCFWVGIGAWGISGILFPAWLSLTVGHIGAADYVHFFISHLLCGLIAGILSFFLVALLVTRTIYPALMAAGPREAHAEAPLSSLARQTTAFSRLAVVVPFLAALTLGFGDPGFQPAFAALAVLGFLMLAVTFQLSRSIQSDLRALQVMVSPEPPAPLFGSSSARWD